MKRIKLIGSVAIIIVVFALWGGLGVKPAHAAVNFQFGENQITSNIADQENPDIYEYGLNNYAIVWQDNRNGNWDIYMFYQEYLGNGNWDVRPEIRITNGQGNNENPKIYNDTIVYQSDRNGNWDIYMYNITSKKETQVTNNTASQINPAIDGNHIVWQDNRNGDWTYWSIYLYDLQTQTEQAIIKYWGVNPAISGNRIVYVDYDAGGDYWLICVNISTGGNEILTYSTTGKGIIANPTIYGDRIAWEKGQNVFWRDLATGAAFQTSGMRDRYPHIYGGYMVFESYSVGVRPGVFLYDVDDGMVHKVASSSGDQELPAISAEWGRFIVYMDDRNGNWDIYLTNFWSTGVGATGPNTQSTPSPSPGNTPNSGNQDLVIIMVSATVVAVAASFGAAVIMVKKRKSRKPKKLYGQT